MPEGTQGASLSSWSDAQMRLGWLIVVLWGATFALFFDGPIVIALGVCAGLCGLVLAIFARDLLKRLFAISWREIALGFVAGLAMAALTYLAFPLFVWLFPTLKPNVTALYGKLFADPGPRQLLPMILLVVLMEEVVFRGVLLPQPSGVIAEEPSFASLWRQLKDRRHWQVLLLSTGVYTLVHIGSRSALLCALALACGLVWGWMRLWRGTLWMALICHAVWDLLVFVMFPLVSLQP